VLVNTADVELMRQYVADSAHADITVVGANDIERGGCRIQSAAGDVDATMATRMARVMEVLGQTEITADDN
jgi:flagellar assembly protein FliH